MAFTLFNAFLHILVIEIVIASLAGDSESHRQRRQTRARDDTLQSPVQEISYVIPEKAARRCGERQLLVGCQGGDGPIAAV
jgi:hypothetical protein